MSSPENPDENKVKLSEITNNTPVKRRNWVPEIENCNITNENDIETLYFYNTPAIRYKDNDEIFIDVVESSQDSNQFTDDDILQEIN